MTSFQKDVISLTTSPGKAAFEAAFPFIMGFSDVVPAINFIWPNYKKVV